MAEREVKSGGPTSSAPTSVRGEGRGQRAAGAGRHGAGGPEGLELMDGGGEADRRMHARAEQGGEAARAAMGDGGGGEQGKG